MAAEVISIEPGARDTSGIDRAARALADGALVAFPTETVYGVAINASIAESVNRLRAVKGRAASKPFTVHIGRPGDHKAYVTDVSPLGCRLIRKGWPGPLTLVFPVGDPEATDARPRLSEAGAASIYADGSVGIRFPDDPVARALLLGAGGPIIASSANIAGEVPPVEAEPIAEKLGDKLDIILDGGATRYRKSSSVVALNGDGYRVLRTGVWDERTLHKFSTVNILFVCTGNTCRSPIAEGICKQRIAERLGCSVGDLPARGIHVHSAGTLGVFGGRASPEAIEVCRQRGIDISGLSPRALTAELTFTADYIFAMARHHIDSIRSFSPRDVEKIVLLNPDGDIADPIGGAVADYERVAEIVARSLDERMREVTL